MNIEQSLKVFHGESSDDTVSEEKTLSEAPQNSLLSAMMRFMKGFREDVAGELRSLYPGREIGVEKSSIIVEPAQAHEDAFSVLLQVTPGESDGLIMAQVSMGDDVVSQMMSGEMKYFDASATPREVAQGVNDLHGRVLDQTGRR